MALQWDTTQCTVLTDLPKDAEERAWHEVMVFMTEVIGLDELTKKNLPEWKFRSAFLHCIGRDIAPRKQEIPFRILEAYIGMRTNATILTRHKFYKKWIGCLERQTRQRIRYIEEGRVVIPKASWLNDYGGHWGEHPEYPCADWVAAVENADTRLGYWDWVNNMANITTE